MLRNFASLFFGSPHVRQLLVYVRLFDPTGGRVPYIIWGKSHVCSTSAR